MAKFLIQDIIPPMKKKASGLKAVHATEAHEGTTHTRAVNHTATHRAHPHHDTAIEKVPELETTHENEIEDMLPENPRAMILEHLYEDTSKSDIPTSFVESRPLDSMSHVDNTFPEHEDVYAKIHSDGDIDAARRIPPQFPSYGGSGVKPSSWIPWIAVPAIVLIGAFFMFNYFARADISIIPKTKILSFESGQSLSALKNPTADELGYSVMKVTLDDIVEVSATGTKTVTTKASGTIIIYNEQTTSQRLIKNTRFQSTAGKIYRINDSIIVPKATVTGGKTTPGSVSVVVYADEAGPDYNSNPTDFTVPGLKAYPQYKKVYARSKGVIAGGASGVIKSVSDLDLREASDNLRISLETKLRAKARGNLAPSQIAYDQGIVLDLKTPTLSTEKASDDSKAVVTENGSLSMVVFDRTLLTKEIAKALVPTYNGEAVMIKNLDALIFGMIENKGDTLWTSDKITFSLTGSPSLVWLVDEEVIRKSLLGIPKSNFKSVMAQFSNVLRANSSLRPFWKTVYPSNPKDIIIKIVDNIDE